MNAESRKPDDRTRQSLRLDPALCARIDRSRLQRPGSVSRNTWITEAILEKLDREYEQKPRKAAGGSADV